jgi:hypothetical protein
VIKDWRLNERSYGALVGLNKKKCVEEYGKDQVKRWFVRFSHSPHIGILFCVGCYYLSYRSRQSDWSEYHR